MGHLTVGKYLLQNLGKQNNSTPENSQKKYITK